MVHTINRTAVFAPLIKSAPAADGSVMVYGKCTGSDLDLDQQRCDATWLRKAVPEWMRIGNIRAQHDDTQAVGKAIAHEELGDGHYIRAHIVDPVAVTKVNAGVFTGFSIGVSSPVIGKSVDAPRGLIKGGQIVEISLVDRPALPTATMSLAKAAGASRPDWLAKAAAATDPTLIAGYLALARRHG